MKYNVTLDERGYVLNISHTGTIRDFVELDLDEYDLTEGRIYAYKLGINKLIFDNDEYSRLLNAKQKKADELEIKDLEKKLAETDYIISRWGEEIVALSNPITWVADVIKINIAYTKKYSEALNNRKKWRERIEELRNGNS